MGLRGRILSRKMSEAGVLETLQICCLQRDLITKGEGLLGDKSKEQARISIHAQYNIQLNGLPHAGYVVLVEVRIEGVIVAVLTWFWRGTQNQVLRFCSCLPFVCFFGCGERLTAARLSSLLAQSSL